MKWIWTLLAIGSWVGAAVLADAKTAVPVIIFLSTLGWFFITIAIGGKKGLPFGVGILVFVACLFGISQVPRLFGSSYNWAATKHFLDTLANKPGKVVLIYLGLLMLGLAGIIAPPIFVGRKLWKRVTRAAKI